LDRKQSQVVGRFGAGRELLQILKQSEIRWSGAFAEQLLANDFMAGDAVFFAVGLRASVTPSV